MSGSGGSPERVAGPVAGALASVLTVYRRTVSPLLAPRCRFAPTCSEYGITALRRHGATRGGVLTVWRVLRCHPFHPGGFDPVPPERASTASSSSGATRC